VTEADITKRLDRVIAILQLAHREEISRARAAIRSDEVDAAILDLAAEWIPAGKLTKDVQRKTKRASSTVRGHITDLVRDGLLEKSGGGPTTAYKATGLV
jgi:hypothetical protein